ncbi:hypothetical protein STANM337S_01894 [Streptomyces tanashiensis]|uniref:hypothetical protein n=1 Tax=Streptomyces tanashiensis TaxID=67367 RepID=UPI0036D13E10
MNLFEKLGNALLSRLAPEATAEAACGSCVAGCQYVQNKCSGAYLYKRCCCIGQTGSTCWYCPTGECSAWQLCGAYC